MFPMYVFFTLPLLNDLGFSFCVDTFTRDLLNKKSALHLILVLSHCWDDASSLDALANANPRV